MRRNEVVPRRTSATPRRKLRRDFDEDFDRRMGSAMTRVLEFGGTLGPG